MDIFETCRSINNYLSTNNEVKARNDLIKLLDYHDKEHISYGPIVNHLIRATGLYPYINTSTASWYDRYIYELFKVDIGLEESVTLHREQSLLLKKLINGDNLAISAPTSFGKSFVIDAFIKIAKPNNVMIIVPTIALTDETRRRLYSKFAHEYNFITTTDAEIADKNIFIFPQERAISYINKISKLDILIVDEFYKAGLNFDKERSPALMRAILKLGDKAKQKYFLAPNISDLNENIFTKNMDFVCLNFNTVFLEKHDLYKTINGNEALKSKALVKILTMDKSKSLIYAGTYSNIEKVSNLIIDSFKPIDKPHLKQFADWLSKHYDNNWKLTNLIRRGCGIHNGQLHRSLSQIQIKLFEDPNGLDNIISTSSIIEGVNTSAEKVIIWRNRNGKARLNDFTYKNIIGRGGRMFRHFIGKVYILEKPPADEDTSLQLELPNELLGDIDAIKYADDLHVEQVNKIKSFKESMSNILGSKVFNDLLKDNAFQTSNFELIKEIATNIYDNPDSWNGLAYLNSSNPNNWDRLLYKALNMMPGAWDTKFRPFVEFIKILPNNWRSSIPQLLYELDDLDINIDVFFKLERNASFKLSALLSDINILYKAITQNGNVDISPFIGKLSHAFLPPVVYQLEEYGLPRMISKKIHNSGIINFENQGLNIHKAIERLYKIGNEKLISTIKALHPFDKYILDYFYDGIKLIHS